MSAELTKQTTYGTPATFWRLGNVEMIRKDNIVRVLIYGYANEEAFLLGGNPLSVFVKEISGSDVGLDLNNLEPNTPAYFLFGQFYQYVMQDEFFTGAIPV